MRLFKATYKDRDGKVRETKKWYVEIRDHLEQRRRLPAYANRKASEAFGRKLEALVACRQCGERPDGDLRKWLESLSEAMTRRLARWGILDGKRAAAAKALADHADDYKAALLAKGNTAGHAATTHSMVTRVLDGCGFRVWSDVSAGGLQAYLAELRVSGIPERNEEGKVVGAHGVSIRTSNAILTAFKAFCKWCVRDGRISESPVAHLQRLNAKTDVKRQRRALSAEELRKLITAAEKGETWRGMPGPERATLYRLAAETGLRWAELCSLKRSSFDLTGDSPCVTVDAAYSKHRREDVLPLRKDTAEALRRFFRAFPGLPEAAAFLHVPAGRVGAKIMRADLLSAKVAYKDASGRIVDFHALRHTFISNLANGGVHPSVAQRLARHSTITLTMDRYTHTFLGDRQTALDVLPDLDKAPKAEAQEARATGTDDAILLGHVLDQNAPTEGDSCRPMPTITRYETQGGASAQDRENIGESQRNQGSKKWQATRDSNPQPLDLESSALPN